MNRRDFTILLGTAAAWPGAYAQARVYRVGVLSAATREGQRHFFDAFEAGMRDLHYVDGQNVKFEYLFADGKFERLPALAAELVRRKPDVLLAHSTPGSLAAKKATADIGIVIVGVADPVGVGLVSSLARPGGNITGITNITAQLAGKRLDLLKEILPKVSQFAVIVNPNDPNIGLQMRSAEAAARALGIRLQPVLEVRRESDLEAAFLAASKAHAGAAIRMVDPLVTIARNRTVALAAKYKLPVVYAFREDAEAGGLIAYGTNLSDQYRGAATLIDKILKGAKPADLPVEQPTRFELTINMKSAKALGVAIPQSILLRADKVIE